MTLNIVGVYGSQICAPGANANSNVRKKPDDKSVKL